jgi:tight adherence protein B
MLYLMFFLTAVLLAGALHHLRGDARQRRRQELRRRVGAETFGADRSEGDDPASLLRETPSELDALFSRAALRVPFLRTTELLLYRAGNPLSPGRLIAISAGLALFGALLGVRVLDGSAGALGAFVGVLPWLYVRRAKQSRMREFDRQFPEALALLTRSLRAGHSLSMGLKMVAEELPDPVGSEFGIAAREISLGLAPNTAMANLQDRLDATDLPYFVTAVLVQQETGGNLAEVLDNLGRVIRDRIQFHGKVKALTAQAAMSANVLLAMPFVVAGAMFLMRPGYLDPLFNTEQGRMMGMGSVVMLSIGYALCKKIARVEV